MADNYEITAQQEVQDIAGDLPVRSMEVDFVTKPSGVRSHVTVPMATYSAASVHDAVSELATEIEQAHTR